MTYNFLQKYNEIWVSKIVLEHKFVLKPMAISNCLFKVGLKAYFCAIKKN